LSTKWADFKDRPILWVHRQIRQVSLFENRPPCDGKRRRGGAAARQLRICFKVQLQNRKAGMEPGAPAQITGLTEPYDVIAKPGWSPAHRSQITGRKSPG